MNKTIKKLVGALLVSLPFIGYGYLAYLKGGLEAILIVFGIVGLIVAVIYLGIRLIYS